jgi:hypothetical protein
MVRAAAMQSRSADREFARILYFVNFDPFLGLGLVDHLREWIEGEVVFLSYW